MEVGCGFFVCLTILTAFPMGKFFVTSITLISKKNLDFSSHVCYLKVINFIASSYFDLMPYALLLFVIFYRSTAILLMLCNALARGLILCWIPKPKLSEKKKKDAATDRSRKAAGKKDEKANVIQSFSVDPSGLPDIKAALEVQSPHFL